jgi:hypothetical protein
MKSALPSLSPRQQIFAAARKQAIANTLAALKSGDHAALCQALDESVALRNAQVDAFGTGLPADIANALFPGGDPRACDNTAQR